MSERIGCLIEGCKRTRVNKPGFSEWICQKHWGAIPKNYRKLHAMANRKYKKGQINTARINRIWEKCKQQAYQHAWSV